MTITRKAIPRRTVLRGIGASLTLPLLDGMVPVFAARSPTAALPVMRLGVVYLPNGVMMGGWTPSAEGSAFDVTPILQPLAPFRDRLLVLSGLNGAKGGGNHAGAATRFLTGLTYNGGKSGMDLLAGISMDQFVAKAVGENTQLASLELSLDRHDMAGACDGGMACAYSNTISWRSASTPLPMENNPRAVFERLFGGGNPDPAIRLAQIRRRRSMLDAVLEKIADLQRDLGPADRLRLNEYLEAVRDIERRIQKAEEQSGRQLPVPAQPAGIPAQYDEYAKLMFDLQVVAYQCDLTRVITFMFGREQTNRTFPEIDISEAWHATSHHQNDPQKIATMTRINVFHSTLLAYYLEKLGATPDGDGSLLDHLILLYGAGMSDSNQHDPSNLPVLLAGGGAGRVRMGRHLKFSGDTPMANLLVTVMDKCGVRVETIGNSTGKIDVDALSLG